MEHGGQGASILSSNAAISSFPLNSEQLLGRGSIRQPHCGRHRQPIGQDHGKGGPRGYDAGKKVCGRRRHIVVDTLGLVLSVAVHPANVQDRDGAKLALAQLPERAPHVKHIWADGAYSGKLEQWAKDYGGWILEPVRRRPGQRGVKVVPRRWVVERTFGWLSLYRRLSKDYEVEAALLVFNRDRNMATLLKSIPEVVGKHPNYKRDMAYNSETGFRYIFGHRDEWDRELTLTVLVFDIPSLAPINRESEQRIGRVRRCSSLREWWFLFEKLLLPRCSLLSVVFHVHEGGLVHRLSRSCASQADRYHTPPNPCHTDPCHRKTCSEYP